MHTSSCLYERNHKRKIAIPYLCKVLKKLAALILLLAFAAQTFSQPLMLLSYYFNNAAYAKDCINKARPKMHCNGKCQLMKKMKQEEKSEQQNPERKMENKNEVLSSRSSFLQDLIFHSTFLSRVFVTLNDNTEIKMPRSFFHPPGC